MVNKVILEGYVGREPAIKTTNAGERVAQFSLATNESWTDKATGERRQITDWHQVVVFGPVVDIVEKYVRKGTRLFIEAKLRTRSYETDGMTRYVTECVVRGFGTQIVLLDKREGAGSPDNIDAYDGGSPDYQAPLD